MFMIIGMRMGNVSLRLGESIAGIGLLKMVRIRML